MGNQNWLGFSVGIGIDLFFTRVENWRRFLCAGQKLVGFCVRAEHDLFYVWIEIDLVFVCGPKMTCFFCGDRLAWCGWSKWAWFCMLVENHLVFVRASNLTFFLFGWLKLTWFQHGASKFTWFQCRDRNWLVFCVGVENDLVLESGSKLTCFFFTKNRIDLNLDVEWKLTWFQCGWSRLTWVFIVWGIELHYVYVFVVIDLISVWRININFTSV